MVLPTAYLLSWGGVVMEGGTWTIRTALELVTAAAILLTTTV